jgi:16S rRNA (guanine527-N7)-methyltransferase
MSLSLALDALVQRASVVLESDARARLLVWLEAAKAWNAKLDLTAARTDAALVEILVLDLLHLAPSIGPGAVILDVGTGAGAPGLGLALLRSDVRVACVEPLAKRVAFLRTVIGAANVEERVVVSGARLDPSAAALPADLQRFAPSFDLAVSRATFAPATWADFGLRLAEQAVLMLVDESPPLPPGARTLDDRRYEVPSSGAPRRLLRIARAAP